MLVFKGVVFLSLFLVVLTDKCNNVTCPKVPKHYEEIGCTPIINPNECCPQSYDCSDFYGRNLTKCYHNGNVYEPQQRISDSQLTSSCTVGCFCSKHGHDEPAKIVCAHIDCPEFFGEDPSTGKECISQYEQNSCCKERDVCDDDLKLLSTCEFNGQKYYEGQRMDAGESCYSCLCGKGFENKPAHLNKHCQKINCKIDLHYSDRLYDGCVPIYYKTEDCCPIGTRCPDDSTTIVKTKNSIQGANSPQCTFGDLKLSIGDNLSPEGDDNCNVCTCKIPPSVTCVKIC